MYHTDTSYNIIEMLRDRKLDIGIISNPPDRLAKLTERPLIKDPFIIIIYLLIDYLVCFNSILFYICDKKIYIYIIVLYEI